MIKFIYEPPMPTFAHIDDPSPLKGITMELRNDITWDEATEQFHNFLRGAGYVIPYDFEYDAERGDKLVVKSLQDYYECCSDSGDEDLLWAIDRVISDYMEPDSYHAWKKEKNA